VQVKDHFACSLLHAGAPSSAALCGLFVDSFGSPRSAELSADLLVTAGLSDHSPNE